jgi:ankyrin repeat protein
MLHWICYHDDQERSVPLARLLLERGADTDPKDAYFRTALHIAAALQDSRPIAPLLLAHGADVNATEKWGRTPLHFAANFLDGLMVKLLLESGADVNATREDGNSPLQLAFRIFADVFALLVAHEADREAIWMGWDQFHGAASPFRGKWWFSMEKANGAGGGEEPYRRERRVAQ